MRLGSLVMVAVLAAACSSPAAAGPHWPKPTPRESDGGESLAPRAAARSIAARSDDRSADRSDKPAAAPPASTTAPTDRPAQTPVNLEEPVTTEDIVIEVEE